MTLTQPSEDSNRLRDATSPYLLQHADNPVHWQQWQPQVLDRARQQDKPILLSIGYSACHWCHVMAHESFEDSATAEVMNELFINVKVDREERPDLDKVYQTAHQLLTGRPGGWPLTMFLDPRDLTPFFAGTYFPKQPRHGLPAFQDLLNKIASAYREHREQIRRQNDELRGALQGANPKPAPQPTFDSSPLVAARDELAASFDSRYGGFGSAPKFPHPTSLERLMRHWHRTQEPGAPDHQSLHMALFSLERMARGGIRDHLGGGFYRYSVDDFWMVPHFEKMLYDNAQLLGLYAQAWQISRNPLFREAADQIATWATRDMQSADGGFYSSQDADSDGCEGSFYLWDPAEVQALLSASEYALFSRCYGLDRSANFAGAWHLHQFVPPSKLAQQRDLPYAEVDAALASARAKLLARRASRAAPGRDDKILSSWNALMIKAMAQASRILGCADCLRSAERAAQFLQRNLWRDGRLLATCKDTRASLDAYLDDYAFLIDALLELLQTRWRRQDLDLAIVLADSLLDRFWDPEHGGFFFTASDQEALIHRPKPIADEAIPAGNGIAAQVLLRLGQLLGEPRYLDAAERTLAMAWESLRRFPQAHCSLLTALDVFEHPGDIIVIRNDDPDLQLWRASACSAYAPSRYVAAIPSSATQLPGLLDTRTGRSGGIAYICSGTHCRQPVTALPELEAELGRAAPSTE